MFGEYAIYCDGKVVALVCDDQLFVKQTAAGKAYAGAYEEAQPYKGAKPSLLISGDQVEDAAWLSTLIRVSAADMPMPKPKSKKKG
jgi:TfoX/Sxy family transcriptional regulator of competence genes